MEGRLPPSSWIEIGVGVGVAGVQLWFPNAIPLGRGLFVVGVLAILHGLFPGIVRPAVNRFCLFIVSIFIGSIWIVIMVVKSSPVAAVVPTSTTQASSSAAPAIPVHAAPDPGSAGHASDSPSRKVADVIPSFFYVFPNGVFPVAQEPNSHSVLLLWRHRGHTDLFNLQVLLHDMTRARMRPPNQPPVLSIQNESMLQRLAELDAAGYGVGFPPGFQWTMSESDHLELVLELSHRHGQLGEMLNMRRVGGTWAVAMRVVDGISHRNLAFCRDAAYPSDSSFGDKLPPCSTQYSTEH